MNDDTCRCHDNSCPARQSCARWLHRNEGGPGASHIETMRDDCKHYMPELADHPKEGVEG